MLSSSQTQLTCPHANLAARTMAPTWRAGNRKIQLCQQQNNQLLSLRSEELESRTMCQQNELTERSEYLWNSGCAVPGTSGVTAKICTGKAKAACTAAYSVPLSESAVFSPRTRKICPPQRRGLASAISRGGCIICDPMMSPPKLRKRSATHVITSKTTCSLQGKSLLFSTEFNSHLYSAPHGTMIAKLTPTRV